MMQKKEYYGSEIKTGVSHDRRAPWTDRELDLQNPQRRKRRDEDLRQLQPEEGERPGSGVGKIV